MKNDKDFLKLIDRLRDCSDRKYPDRKWNQQFYDFAVQQWKDKIELLIERVEKLEFEEEK